jgi:hypothetical protein
MKRYSEELLKIQNITGGNNQNPSNILMTLF